MLDRSCRCLSCCRLRSLCALCAVLTSFTPAVCLGLETQSALARMPGGRRPKWDVGADRALRVCKRRLYAVLSSGSFSRCQNGPRMLVTLSTV